MWGGFIVNCFLFGFLSKRLVGGGGGTQFEYFQILKFGLPLFPCLGSIWFPSSFPLEMFGA